MNSAKIVLDNSILLAWYMADEDDPVAEGAMQAAVDVGAVVPGLWWYEFRNALIVNERRGRLDAAGTQIILTNVRDLEIELDHAHDESVVLELARVHALSVYDAAYLEVTQRLGLSLATLDGKLRRAAEAMGIAFVR